MSIISISNLRHSYGSRRALDDVDLSIEAGEIFALLGPNGSGKTTLFRILTTLMPTAPGHVWILDMDVAERAEEVRQRIGVVFQSPSIDKQLTAEENLRHHGHLYGLRGPELQGRIEHMLGRFGLGDRRRDYAGDLSGGMRRRVELAKGLLTRPNILLMDEPSTGLDPAARIEMWQALQTARQEEKVTILLTTHLMDEGDRADRLAIMHAGKVVACGTPLELKEQIGGDVITMTARDAEGLKSAIQRKLGIEAEVLEGVVRIERPKAHEFVPTLVEAVPGLIDAVSIGKPTLEDVFIHVTGHRFAQEDAHGAGSVH